MKDEIQKLLFDISEAADSIFEYLGEKKDFNIYAKNKMMRRAVEREFEIIGEAMNAILKIEPEFPIKNARRIVSLRNQVIHGYDSVDKVIIWGIINRDLPNLKAEVKKLLAVNHEDQKI
ncbi:MAG: DUF86 domain-containing protein [Deltaproteobacteria bacterium]|nr:MAG: DUF86 domain-containing protein [Deltaproteobacteria bacterium]